MLTLAKTLSFIQKNKKHTVPALLAVLCVFLIVKGKIDNTLKDRQIRELEERVFDLKPPQVEVDTVDVSLLFSPPPFPETGVIVDTVFMVTPDLISGADSLVLETGTNTYMVDGLEIRLNSKVSIPFSGGSPIVRHEIKAKSQFATSSRGWHTFVLVGGGVNWDYKPDICLGFGLGYNKYALGVLANTGAIYATLTVEL